MISQGTGNPTDQPLYDRLWGSGFLPTQVSGRQVPLRRRPGAVPLRTRRAFDRATAPATMLDELAELNRLAAAKKRAIRRSPPGSPNTRLAYRMQTSVPELTDLSQEPEHIFELYGPESRKPGTFAANCLLARRLAERGVRFIQLFHRGWDQHSEAAHADRRPVPRHRPGLGRPHHGSQSSAACSTTRWSIWGGEFGRTVYCQGKLTADDYGRDHHPRCFTIWLAGGGIKPGMTFGRNRRLLATTSTRDPVHVHDLHATMLHCLGIDHTRLTFNTRAATPPDRRRRHGRPPNSGLTRSRPGAILAASGKFSGFSAVYKKGRVTTEKWAIVEGYGVAGRGQRGEQKNGSPKRRGRTDLRGVFYRSCKTDRERLAWTSVECS